MGLKEDCSQNRKEDNKGWQCDEFRESNHKGCEGIEEKVYHDLQEQSGGSWSYRNCELQIKNVHS